MGMAPSSEALAGHVPSSVPGGTPGSRWHIVLAVLFVQASLGCGLLSLRWGPSDLWREALLADALVLAGVAGAMMARIALAPGRPVSQAAPQAEAEASRYLARGVAHDVNNLLTVLALDAEMLDDPQLPQGALQSLSRSMQETCRQGAELTGLLLAYAGRQALQPMLVDLPAELTRMQAALAQTLMPLQRLVLRLPAQGLPMVVDVSALELALRQLVGNAALASAEDGEVSLLLDPPDRDGVLQITIADQGTGMTRAVAAQALLPYFTDRASGFHRGLGLPAADGFARQCGGDISIVSSPGQGTRVTLRLPANLGHGARPGLPWVTVQGLPPPGPARILVVDDNEAVRDSLARRLRVKGHEVMVAGDIGGARARLRLGVDALVTDVVLGGAEDGVALALEARGQDRLLALVFISGVMSSRQPELLEGDDMASFLRKPVNMIELTAVLDGLLAMRALRRAM